ncbi:MAG: hypothetical protein K0S34_1759 [Bacillales bacterium]|jgi:uncharacterized membrane-anchored protein|nr:hypothetical protein [Bacillales bacterium]
MIKNRLWLLLAAQIIIILAIANINIVTEKYGKEVLLKTAPYDPKDVFYGDYVTLNYEINMVDVDKLTFSSEDHFSGRVFVVLEKNMETKYWDVKKVYKKRPEVYKNQVILKGKIVYFDANQCRISYGLETYYIEEGTGERFNELGSLDVIVKVSQFSQKISELVNK